MNSQVENSNGLFESLIINQQSKVLIADEPTGNLDPALRIMNLLEHNQKFTSIDSYMIAR